MLPLKYCSILVENYLGRFFNNLLWTFLSENVTPKILLGQPCLKNSWGARLKIYSDLFLSENVTPKILLGSILVENYLGRFFKNLLWTFFVWKCYPQNIVGFNPGWKRAGSLSEHFLWTFFVWKCNPQYIWSNPVSKIVGEIVQKCTQNFFVWKCYPQNNVGFNPVWKRAGSLSELNGWSFGPFSSLHTSIKVIKFNFNWSKWKD